MQCQRHCHVHSSARVPPGQPASPQGAFLQCCCQPDRGHAPYALVRACHQIRRARHSRRHALLHTIVARVQLVMARLLVMARQQGCLARRQRVPSSVVHAASLGPASSSAAAALRAALQAFLWPGQPSTWCSRQQYTTARQPVQRLKCSACASVAPQLARAQRRRPRRSASAAALRCTFSATPVLRAHSGCDGACNPCTPAVAAAPAVCGCCSACSSRRAAASSSCDRPHTERSCAIIAPSPSGLSSNSSITK